MRAGPIASLPRAGDNEASLDSHASEFIAERGLGPVERSVRLGGSLSIPGHAKLPAELCLVPSGVWVVAAGDRFAGVMFDATSGDKVRYERGTLRDRLLVDGVALTVPPARAGEAMRSLALGRLRKQSLAVRTPAPDEDRFLARLPEPAWALAGSLVRAGDVLVAVRELGDAEEVRSELGANVKQRDYLVMTAERVTAFTLSDLGDSRVSELDAQRLRLELRSGRACLVTGAGEHLLDARQASLVAELLELTVLAPAERLFEAARRLYLVPEGNGLARSRRLVEAAAALGHPLARLVSLLLALGENPHERFADTTLLRVADTARDHCTEQALSELATRWDFAPEPLLLAARELRALGARGEPLALNLRRVHRARAPEDATADADLAEHELLCGEPDRARRIAESRLGRLPPDEDAVLSPAQRSPSHLLRVRLHDLVARASERSARGAVPSLAALARLEPLGHHRLEALAHSTPEGELDERLSQRARDVLACLAPGGLSHPARPGDPDLPRPLERVVLEERVAHPLSRGSGRLAARLSELVAAVPEPELGFLRDFCEELGERHPDARRALKRAAHLLGLGAVRAYVSHGARSLGLRAFGAHEPFVLIGANHLYEGSPNALSGSELDFAFGAELAHLAFGHQRVTVSEVWIGAAGKTRDALLALGMVLPVIAEIGGGRAFQILKRVSPETVARGAEAADRLEKLVVGRKNSLSRALGQHNEELIAAHRLVQLSADRAGLVLAQHLPSALRTILLTRADYRELFVLANDVGLASALERRPLPDAAMADLVVRVRALIAFYLSSDFDAILRNSAFTTPPSRSFSLLP